MCMAGVRPMPAKLVNIRAYVYLRQGRPLGAVYVGTYLFIFCVVRLHY